MLEVLASIALVLVIAALGMLLPSIWARTRADLSIYREAKDLERDLRSARIADEYQNAQSYYPGPGDS